jgi:protein-S-isoprenylcysteine O-methyltransferase Ste14
MLFSEFTRALLLLLPAGILTWLFTHRAYPQRLWAGAFLAYVWQFQVRLLLFALGVQLGIWQFSVAASTLYGVPVDMLIGTSLLFGPLMAMLRPKLPVILLVFADFFVMLIFLPMHLLGPLAAGWLFALSHLAVVPGILLARWTAEDSHLYARAVLQPVSWIILLLWLFPSIVFESSGGSWAQLLERPWHINLVYAIPLLIPTLLLANALYEFAVRGRGTAFPYDPPKHLVTTGVYRYVSNPMQLGIVLMMAGWGLLCQSLWITASAVIAVTLFTAFKDVCNGSCQIGAVDPNWLRYQAQVRKWLPRWTPIHPHDFQKVHDDSNQHVKP